MNAARGLPFLAFLCAAAHADLTIDGELNEAQWQDATQLNDFVLTQPFSRASSELSTNARVLSTPEGLYIGFVNREQNAEQNAAHHARDADQSEADSVTAVIDIDGSGRSAYFFTVSLGNSIKDGTITNEVVFSRDWNGQWQAATHAENEQWTAEIFLPWSSIPVPHVEGDTRDIRVGLSRTLSKRGQIVAYPAAHWTRPTYLSELAPLKIANQQSAGRFDFLPYVTTLHDRVANDSDTRSGFDVVWKPNGSDQVTATFNPDFGQVEADNLVVNFSAQETFFSEQRPFFTENHSLFDLSGPANLRLIHTRRIGARPDAGDAGVSEIKAAAKFSHVGEQFDAGAFWASEDDYHDAKGRDYYALRGIFKSDGYSVGYLATHVERPELNRRATVHTIDGQYQSAQWQWAGLVTGSDIRDDDSDYQNHGLGSVHTWRHRVSDTVTDDFRIAYFDRDYQVRDMGFIERTNLKRFRYARVMSFANDDAQSWTQGRDITLAVRANRNNQNQRLGDEFNIEWNERLRSAARIFGNLLLTSDGYDDLTTRGNGVFKTQQDYDLFVGVFGNEQGPFRIHAELNVEPEGIDKHTYTYHVHPGWVFNEQFSTALGLFYVTSDQWLIWNDNDSNDKHLATYSRDEATLRWDINANLNERHEVRLGWQWLALKAHGVDRYDIINESLQRAGAENDDFVVSQLAIQLRYTWRLGPLSAFYAVYSRGGSEDPDERHNGDQSLQSIFQQSRDNPNAEIFLLKLRLQF